MTRAVAAAAMMVCLRGVAPFAAPTPVAPKVPPASDTVDAAAVPTMWKVLVDGATDLPPWLR